MATRLIGFVTILLVFWSASNVAAQTAAQTVTYTYNPNGQVATATYPNGTAVAYTYDANGNRLGAVVTPDTTPPSAPGAMSVSNVTSDSATINWGQATDNFAVAGYRYQINGGAWSSFSNSQSEPLSDLVPGTTYTVTAEAQDDAGNISAENSFSFTMPPSAPSTPTATNITGNSATVTWGAASDSAGVAGYSYQLNDGTWSAFSNVLSVTLAGLSYGTAYTVAVRAEDSAGNVGPAATGSFTTGPTTPGNPAASGITGTSATVGWAAASDSLGVTGYSYQINGGAWSAFSNVLSVALTGLNYGTTYNVGVRAQDNPGNISATATGSFTTLPSAPGTPTASNIAGTSAMVSWSAATDANGVTGYSYQVNGGAWSAFSDVLSVNLTGLAYGTSYTVAVLAQDASNSGPPSSGTFMTPPSTPGVPTVSNITGTSATVNWTAAAAGSGITGYSYQVNGGAWSGFSNVQSVGLTGLGYGTPNTVGVRAQDSYGSVGATSTASFTTAPSAPGAPTASSITSSTATVSWAAATSASGIGGYRYSINGGSSWATAGTATSANLSGLARGTAYTVLVQAETPSGTWGTSSSGSFTTSPYYTDTFSMTAGLSETYQQLPNGVWVPAIITNGYRSGSLGTLSPTTTSNGLTLWEYVATVYYGAGIATTTLEVYGFGSNPGIAWLQSVSLGTVTLTGASATSFSYSNGMAAWTWPNCDSCTSGTLAVSHE